MSGGPQLERGTQVGRYLILEPLGMGGMAVVYAAYDPELDRKVAVKLVRADAVGEAARLRLVREAQAIARLAHPNVVAVFDAGTWEGQVFLAMELVDGGTLTEWLAQGKRSWQEVREVFGQAGRGLAAAHAAGLVHRDFKPSNVLIGKDGRVRVGDFGLARPADAGGEARGAAAASALDVALTNPGDLLGTPRYMAPEQHQRRPADARSDQFGFCVALYEALYGQPPFAPKGGSVATDSTVEGGGEDGDLTSNTADLPPLMALAAEVLAGRVREPPASARVPARLYRVVLRGLRTDPTARYPSMDALLTELGRDRSAANRRLFVGGTAAALAVVAGMALGSRDAPAAPSCSLAAARADQVWGGEQRAALTTRFVATGHPRAADAAARAAAVVDDYAGHWREMRVAACEATRHGEQSGALLDLRMRCLDRRLNELAGTIALVGADRDAVDGAARAIGSVTALDGCADAAALSAPVPPPEAPALAAQVAAVGDDLDQVIAYYRAGRYREGLERAVPVSAAAERTGYDPLIASALFWQGELAAEAGDAKAARALLERALPAAGRGHDDNVAADAMLAQIWLLGVDGDEPDAALALRPAAEAAVHRIGDPPALRARLLHYLASVLKEQRRNREAIPLEQEALALRERGGDRHELAASLSTLAELLRAEGHPAEAIGHLRRVRALLEQTLGREHPTVAIAINQLAFALERHGELAEAGKLYQEALQLRIAVLGADHPLVAKSHYSIGNLAFLRGELDTAMSHHQAAFELRRRLLGSEHVETAEAEMVLAETLGAVGRTDEGIAAGEHALAVMTAKLGADNPRLAGPLQALDQVHRRRHEWDAAVAAEERVLALRRKAYGPTHQKVGFPICALAEIDAARGACARAVPRFRETLALWKDALAADDPAQAEPLTGLGACLVDLGRAADALEPLERALAIRQAMGETPDLAETSFAMARALAASGGDRERAQKLAGQANKVFASTGYYREEQARIAAWQRGKR